MKVAVYRKEKFSAAHRLHNPEFTESQNQSTFGKCNNVHYHGHNYDLIVKVTGPIDPTTGYVMDLKILKDVIKQQVIERFHEQNLNFCPEFETLNPTAENISVVIYNLIRAQLDEKLDLKITLYETERNFVEYPA